MNTVTLRTKVWALIICSIAGVILFPAAEITHRPLVYALLAFVLCAIVCIAISILREDVRQIYPFREYFRQDDQEDIDKTLFIQAWGIIINVIIAVLLALFFMSQQRPIFSTGSMLATIWGMAPSFLHAATLRSASDENEPSSST